MNKLLSCACGSKWQDEAYALLRIVTGLMFFMHGYAKFTGGAGKVAGFFENVGVPLANVMAYVVTYGEMLIGIAFVLGVFAHWASKLAIFIILGAIYFVHLTNGYGVADGGYEYPLLILAVCFVILTHGADRYSLDSRRNHSGDQV